MPHKQAIGWYFIGFCSYSNPSEAFNSITSLETNSGILKKLKADCEIFSLRDFPDIDILYATPWISSVDSPSGERLHVRHVTTLFLCGFHNNLLLEKHISFAVCQGLVYAQNDVLRRSRFGLKLLLH